MGHANLSNLSDFFIRRLYAKGKLSMGDCVEAMVKKQITFNASEGAYDEPYMLSSGLEQAVHFLWTYDAPEGPTVLDKLASAAEADEEFTGPIIEPVSPTPAQLAVMEKWEDGFTIEEGADCYQTLDSIVWRFAPGWRREYPEIPRLGSVTN